MSNTETPKFVTLYHPTFGDAHEVPAGQVERWKAQGYTESKPDAPTGEGAVPAKNARKDELVAYAVSKGFEPAKAEAMTREDLVTTLL